MDLPSDVVDSRRIGAMVAGGIVLMVVWLAIGAVAVGMGSRRSPIVDGPPALTAAERRQLVAIADRATLTVTALGCNGTIAGTGFLAGGRLYTNRHLVDGAGGLTVEGPPFDGSARASLTVMGTADLDLVALRPATDGTSPPAGEALRLAEVDPDLGAPVLLIGRIDGQLRHIEATVHIFTRGPAYASDAEVMLLDGATVAGFSGGPVLDRRGRVVGVLRSVDEVTALTVAIPVSQLQAWEPESMQIEQPSSCP